MSATDLFGETRRAGAARIGKVARRGPQTSGYARIDKDAYNTPAWCVDALIAGLARFGEAGVLPGPVWEPACGLGNIAVALRRYGLAVIASDIADYGCADWIRVDYLKEPMLRLAARRQWADGEPPAAIVTNPPYRDRLAEAFAERAIGQMILDPPDRSAGRAAGRESGLVALLLPHEWDCAGGRGDLFDDPVFGFAAKIVLRRRIVWIGPDGRPLGDAEGRAGGRAGGRRAGPTKHHAWFVWSRRLRAAAVAPDGGAAGGAGGEASGGAIVGGRLIHV